jgi:hypothetical protein
MKKISPNSAIHVSLNIHEIPRGHSSDYYYVKDNGKLFRLWNTEKGWSDKQNRVFILHDLFALQSKLIECDEGWRIYERTGKWSTFSLAFSEMRWMMIEDNHVE